MEKGDKLCSGNRFVVLPCLEIRVLETPPQKERASLAHTSADNARLSGRGLQQNLAGRDRCRRGLTSGTSSGWPMTVPMIASVEKTDSSGGFAGRLAQ